MARRRVERTATFEEEAHRYFPAEGTSQRNSFDVLDRTILRPLEESLTQPGRFEGLTQVEPGSPIRLFPTQHAFIPPVIIYVGLSGDTVYLMGFECDLEYGETIANDPDD